MDALDSKTYLGKVARTRKLADKVLKLYGPATVPLDKLRESMDRELAEVSLSDLILKEREVGW